MRFCLIIFLPMLLAACASSTNEFSCDKTAGDSCLTIEQVDAMTHFADDSVLAKHKKHHRLSKARNGIWINNYAK